MLCYGDDGAFFFKMSFDSFLQIGFLNVRADMYKLERASSFLRQTAAPLNLPETRHLDALSRMITSREDVLLGYYGCVGLNESSLASDRNYATRN